jgi:DNA polymerase III alpha subunit
MMLKKHGIDHKYAWLYDHGIGYVSDERTLAYIFNIRNFITSSGKEMASVYCWDGKQFFKIVVFAAVYKKVKQMLKEHMWYAIRLTAVEDKNSLNRLDSFKLESADKIIPIDDYIKRKNLVEVAV